MADTSVVEEGGQTPAEDGGDENQQKNAKEERKIVKIFNHYDNDKDGHLSYSELKKLHHDTEGEVLSKKEYKKVCAILGANHAKGLKVRNLILAYQARGQSGVDEDYDKIFGEGAYAAAQSKEPSPQMPQIPDQNVQNFIDKQLMDNKREQIAAAVAAAKVRQALEAEEAAKALADGPKSPKKKNKKKKYLEKKKAAAAAGGGAGKKKDETLDDFM